MKRMDIVLLLCLLMLLGACQSAPQETATPPAGDDIEDSTPASPPTGEAYPAQPSPTPRDADYPAPEPPATQGPPTAYPPDMALWIIRPLGEQCADPASYAYQNIDEAATALEEAGVEVLETAEVTLAVCTACDCPTSEHFRAQIRAQDLAVAQELGWRQE